MREADKQGVKILALPELCLTGYTCGDLFLQDTLLDGAEEGLMQMKPSLIGKPPLFK